MWRKESYTAKISEARNRSSGAEPLTTVNLCVRYQMADLNPKLCECGCGKPAPIATDTRPKFGHVKGQPVRFVLGHYNKTHGMYGTPTHTIWRSMLHRCRVLSDTNYPRYGARGIKVCERWLKLENFLADMGPKLPGLSIERIDNDGNYEPNNCRWATKREQANNRRTSRLLTALGKTQTIAMWSRETGITESSIYARVTRLGWSVDRALTEPLRRDQRRKSAPPPLS